MSEEKKPDGVILQQVTGTAQVINKGLDLAKEKPLLLGGILLALIPTVYFGGNAYLGIKQAEKEKVDTVIQIDGGDVDPDAPRNAKVDALRSALDSYPVEDKEIRIVQYFNLDPIETYELMGIQANGDATPRGVVREAAPGSAIAQAFEAHAAGNCFQQEQLSSCPVINKKTGQVAAFVSVSPGSTADAEAFLNSEVEADGLAVPSKNLILALTQDAQ